MAVKLLGLAGLISLCYAAIVLLLAGCQRSLIYHPRTAPENQLLELARSEGMTPWRNGSGEIIGWKSPAPNGNDAGKALLILHGNAGYALHRTYLARGFQSMPGGEDWAAHILEYPGYGARGGKPSEAGIREAAREAAEILFRENRSAVYLAGESLGSGPASWLAGTFPEKITGMLLVTPFTTLADAGRVHFPLLPVRLALREKYDNVRALEGYRGPVAFLLAGRDETVPAFLGQRLHDSYPGPKILWIQENQRHNTLSYDADEPWWRELSEFLRRH